MLCPGEPHWTLGNLERVRVPALLQQVVEGRLARLGETARDHLAVAAVVGQRVPLDVWADGRRADRGRGAADASSGRSRRSCSRPETTGTEVGFAHALVREVLYEGVLPPRRRVWHRRVAEVLADVPGADPDAVADHFQRAGDARAIDWLVLAGERAQGAYALLTARDRFAAAVALLEGDDSAGGRARLAALPHRPAAAHGRPRPGGRLPRGGRARRARGRRPRAGRLRPVRPRIRLVLSRAIRSARSRPSRPAQRRSTRGQRTHLRSDPAPATWVADVWPGRHAVSRSKWEEDAPTNPRHGTLAAFLALAGRFVEAQAVGATYLAQVGRAWSTHTPRDTLWDRPTPRPGWHWPRRRWAMPCGRGRDSNARRRPIAPSTTSFSPRSRSARRPTEVALPLRTTDVADLSVLSWRRSGRPASRVPDMSQGWLRRFELEALLLDGGLDQAERVRANLLDGHIPSASSARVARGSEPLRVGRGDRPRAWSNVRAGLPPGPTAEPGHHIFQNAVALLRLWASNLALDDGDLPTAVSWLAGLDHWVEWSGTVRWRADRRLLWARYHRIAGDPDRARQTAGASAGGGNCAAPAAGAARSPPFLR